MASHSAHTKPLISTTFCLLIVTICAATMTLASARRDVAESSGADTAMRKRHHSWAAKHGRTYKDSAEKEMRYKVFKANAEFIDAGDKNKSLPLLGTNKFSDMTDQEFEAMFVGWFRKRFKGAIPGFMYGDLPAGLASQPGLES